MKTARVVVFAMIVAGVGAGTTPTPPPASQDADLGMVEGRGLLDLVACGGCLGSGALAAATGWGAFWTAAMRAGDGALATFCVDACTAAF